MSREEDEPQADSCFPLRSSVRVKITLAAQLNHASSLVFSGIHLQIPWKTNLAIKHYYIHTREVGRAGQLIAVMKTKKSEIWLKLKQQVFFPQTNNVFVIQELSKMHNGKTGLMVHCSNIVGRKTHRSIFSTVCSLQNHLHFSCEILNFVPLKINHLWGLVKLFPHESPQWFPNFCYLHISACLAFPSVSCVCS